MHNNVNAQHGQVSDIYRLRFPYRVALLRLNLQTS